MFYKANLHDTIYCLLFIFACLLVQSSPSHLSSPALSNQWHFQPLSPKSRRQDGSVVRAPDRNTTPRCQRPVGSQERCSPAFCLCSPTVKRPIFPTHRAILKHTRFYCSRVMRHRLSLCIPLCMPPTFIKKSYKMLDGSCML